ncbi:MAG: hypothetical protein GY772_19895, partial [bacterium]|nr:hypothetical protein [bacterium]
MGDGAAGEAAAAGRAAGGGADVAAPAAAPVVSPNFVFSIGERGYDYKATDRTVNGHPLYKCVQGTTDDRSSVLWLYYSTSVVPPTWVATEASATSVDPVNEGVPKFIALDAGDDITVPGPVRWGWWDDEKNRFDCSRPMRFITTNWQTLVRLHWAPKRTSLGHAQPSF